MKWLACVFAAALVLACVACQTRASREIYTDPATGPWSATLTSSNGQRLGTISFFVAQNGSALSMSRMDFSHTPDLAKCFSHAPLMTGQLQPGKSDGGPVTIDLSSTPAGGGASNSLNMQGNIEHGMTSGAGSFTLTGKAGGCASASGKFTIAHSGPGIR